MSESWEQVIGKVADDLSAADLLALARDRKAAEHRAAADLLLVAARWADMHPPESIHSAATFATPGCEHEEPIAGVGAPLVAEFCIAELGAVLGLSSGAAKKLIGHALELRHRLPRLWTQVQSGLVPAWQARIVAETTIHTTPRLTVEAAGFVDAQVAAVAGRVAPAQLDRLVAEAIKRYDLAEADPASDPEDGHLHVDPRHVTINDEDVHFAGTMRIEAEVDIADALDLGHAVSQGAAALKALGSTESLDVRRAKALGDLARTQTSLDLSSATATEPATATKRDTADLPAARELVLHLHFDAHLEGVRTVFGPTGRMENGQRLVLLDQVKAWCGDTHTKITIKPVIDLTTEQTAPGYAIPDRIREQVVLRDRTCVFPWCTRPARRSDIDHIVAYDHDADAEGRPQPGPTTTSNLACLCRSHHRLKTHTAWHYRMVEPGVFEWTSPHAHHYLRDHAGTRAFDTTPPDRQ
ncbi:DUF222 domain-containing protein [Microbacterium sp. ARD31]|uniref:HNH endonuclease n=1 Tax=Microbacterium sp. ARD31 TaxID=2962576 RepID=UPI002880FED2|nr:DUF222 domain-containing protein [Microbacterium sp. ARD31]MDT0188152.1 DUF222 domain-containing protein [Microbacterium sp. ARD31]